MRILLFLLALTGVASAQMVLQCSDEPNFACALTAGAIGVVSSTCTTGKVVNGVDSVGNLTCVTGGSGNSSPNLLAAMSCMPLTANQGPFYMGASGCLDVSEANVSAPVKNNTTLQNLTCTASAALTSGQVTVTGRLGTCGGTLSDVSAFTCIIQNGTPVCNSGANTFQPTAGQCFDLKVLTSSINTPVAVACTWERTG